MGVVFKFQARLLGGHYHVDVFVGKSFGLTLAKSGELVLDVNQWHKLRNVLCVLPWVRVEENAAA